MTSLRLFNTSTKDSHSLKLRNSQLSSKESERLDTDNMKMEQRLKELKLTMGRQKQERDKLHSNGAIWSSGKQGAVTTHGSDLMRKEPSKPSNSKGKPRKIRVLKDSPIEVPKRPSIAASLASKKSPPKLKGPACGQCEQKVVALTCMECGENYCTSCFAKFHLKGALKNHRSLPYQSNSSSSASSLDLNNGMTSSPKSSLEGLPPRPSSASRRTTTSTDASIEDQIKTIPVTVKDPSERTGGIFLEGNFNEEESALSFAQALAEWRASKDADPSASSQPKDVKKVQSIASGTSTEPQPIEQVEIQFKKDTSITYADKLLIKKHRRTELSPMSSPRDEKDGLSSRQELLPLTNGHVGADSDDENELQEEHDRYVGIFAKSKSSDAPRLESALSIVDITETPAMDIAEMESTYNVQEVDAPDGEIMHQSARGDDVITPSNPYYQETPLVPHHSEPTPKDKSDDLSITTRSVSSVRVVSSQQKQRRVDSSNKPSRTVSTPLRSKLDSKPVNKQQRANPKLDTSLRLSSARPTQDIKSTREKNQIKSKSKSANVAMHRRPLSHTQDIAPSSENVSGRTSSKENESGRGSSMGLTSTPSGMLLMTSHLTRHNQHHYKAGLGDFFLAGLGGEEEDTVKDDDMQHGGITPTDKLPACSYTGTMQAWRPDSSLATPALRESRQPYSPSPPAKSGRQSHRSAAKTRSLKAQAVKLIPDADTTISFVLSEHLPGKEDWNGNNGDDEGLDNRRLHSRQIKEPDRSSSRIEVDGDDMSVYDNTGKDYTEMEDKETLEKLTWELASQSGRITADGRLTSMSLPDADDDIYRENSFSQDAELGIVDDAGLGSGLSTPFDFLTGESLSREVSDEEMELQRFTADVQALT